MLLTIPTLKPMDSFGKWRKWKLLLFFLVNAEFYRVVWTINALLTVCIEMLPFSGNDQNIKMFGVPRTLCHRLGQKKKNCYVALSRPTVKCEKTGSFFFFFCCWKCQIWAKNLLKFVFNGLKKHLYMRFDCIPPEFSPFRNFKKNIGKLNSLTVRKKKKKKKKKKSTDRPNFLILVGWGQHNNFFWALCTKWSFATGQYCNTICH